MNEALLGKIRLLEHKHYDTVTVDLVTKGLLSDYQACSISRLNMLDGWMIHVLGRTEQDGVRFHHATHNMNSLEAKPQTRGSCCSAVYAWTWKLVEIPLL